MRQTIGINMGVTADGWLRMSLPTDYADAVRDAGGRPRLLACVEDEQLLREEIDVVDAFLFVGEADYPLQRAVRVLGIFGGCQLVNIAGG